MSVYETFSGIIKSVDGDYHYRDVRFGYLAITGERWSSHDSYLSAIIDKNHSITAGLQHAGRIPAKFSSDGSGVSVFVIGFRSRILIRGRDQSIYEN